MKYYTSYYQNIKNIPDDYKLVSISGNIPEYLQNKVDIWDKRLAPNWSLFSEYKNSPEGKAREEQYVKRFKSEVLPKYDITQILKDWGDKCGLNEKYVLLCYETPDCFCHRHIVSEAISQKYNVEVPEIGIDSSKIMEGYRFIDNLNFDEDEW